MQAGIKYTAKIPAGLQDPTGAVLQKDYVWSFSTTNPFVVSMQPNDGETNVWIDRAVQVTFSQPMNHASAEKAFSLRQGAADGPQVAGTFSWITSTVPMGVGTAPTFGKLAAPVKGGQGVMLIGEMMVFTPTKLLERDTTYYANLAQGVEGESGGMPTPVAYQWSFTTIKPLYVIRTDPANGGSAAPYASMDIYFSAPVDEAIAKVRDDFGGNFADEGVHLLQRLGFALRLRFRAGAFGQLRGHHRGAGGR